MQARHHILARFVHDPTALHQLKALLIDWLIPSLPFPSVEKKTKKHVRNINPSQKKKSRPGIGREGSL